MFEPHYKADTDVILQILQQIDQLEKNNNLILLTHIKVHQDKYKAENQLSFNERLNIEADKEATKGLKYKAPEYLKTPANGAHLYRDGNIIMSIATKQLREAYLSQQIRTQMIQKFKWTNNTPDMIWWHALQKLSKSNKIKIQKFIHNRWATNHRNHKYSE